MASVSTVGKVAYIYDEASDTWYPVAGTVNTSVNQTWTGTQAFGASVTLNSVVNAKAGVNNFADATARDAAITSPTSGIVVFLRDSNQIQYYANGGWRIYGDNAQLVTKTADFQLALTDAGRTIDVSASGSTPIVVTIPLNSTTAFPVGAQIAFIQTGEAKIQFSFVSGVTSISKGGNKKTSATGSPATLIKKATDTWILIGDLTA